MAYTTKGKIQRFLNVDIAASFDAEIASWIDSVASWIDKYCGKTFESAEETRYFDGNGKTTIMVDDFTGSPTILILNVDGTTGWTLVEGHSDDYLVYPLNSTPKNELRLVSGSQIGNFPNRSRSVQITANFGYSVSVPNDIELAATKLVAEIVKEGLKGGKLSSIQLGDYQANFQKVNEKADALGIYQILDMYRDIEL